MKRIIIFTLFIIGWSIGSSPQSTGIDLFGSELPLDCSLAFDMKKLNREKYNELYQEARFICSTRDTTFMDRTIRLKARGIYRKNNCHMPPIRLDLKDSTNNSNGFEGHKSIKLVTHCENSKAYQEYLLKEYLVYKLYNLLTEQSFRVRLMKLLYIDTGRKEPKEYASYGFVIEDIDRVAERNDALEIEMETLNREHMEKESMTRLALFQFMIGNTDWSIPGLHNIKLLKSNDFRKIAPVPVPYDFDFSGFVNAPYAIPAEGLEIDNVRIRYFRGICMSLEEYKTALQEFHDIKESVYQTILEFEYIGDKTRDDLIRFIDGFYQTIESDRHIQSTLMRTCKELGR